MTDIAGRVLALLRERGQTVSLAESTAGGLATARLIAIPGASAAVAGAVVAYDNRSKMQLLGVPRELLREYGAVSVECALAMAEGARCCFGTDWALAETGIAGPGGGSPDRPAGTVFIAVAGPGASSTQHLRVEADRSGVMAAAAEAVLSLLALSIESA